MKNRLTHNLGLKILSIIVAILVWVTIINIEDPVINTTFHNIPVHIENEEVVTSRGYQYNIESGEEIDVKVKGKRSIVDNLTDADFRATADFNSFTSMYMATITVECISHPEDDIIVSTNTETMAVKLEESDTQPFSIRIVRQGNVKEGYYLSDTTASTSLIQVTGSKTQIENIKEVTVDIDVEGKTNTFSIAAIPQAYDRDGNLIDKNKITFSQDSINVDVSICPTKLVEIAVHAEGEPEHGYYLDKLEYAPDSVLIAAPEKELAQLNSISIPCNITGAKENVELQIDLNEFIASNYGDSFIPVNENPTVGVIASIVKMEIKELTLNSQSIEVRNLAAGLECSLYTVSNAHVTVMGRKEALQDIIPTDLDLYVNVAGCSVGTYSKQIFSDYEGELEIIPGSIMIRISNVVQEEDIPGDISEDKDSGGLV